MYKMEPLYYSYSDFYPYIDGYTMDIHYNKHYYGYLEKLNSVLKEYPEYFNYNINTLLYNIGSLPFEIKESVRKYGGGYANHNLYWKSLVPVFEFKNINPEFKKVIEENFDTYDNFIKKFKESANNLFGSGYVFLVIDKCKLKIVSTMNQDSPFIYKYIPILALDLWEHAYYLNYQYKRKDYIDNFFKVLNWEYIYNEYKKFCI